MSFKNNILNDSQPNSEQLPDEIFDPKLSEPQTSLISQSEVTNETEYGMIEMMNSVNEGLKEMVYTPKPWVQGKLKQVKATSSLSINTYVCSGIHYRLLRTKSL